MKELKVGERITLLKLLRRRAAVKDVSFIVALIVQQYLNALSLHVQIERM